MTWHCNIKTYQLDMLDVAFFEEFFSEFHEWHFLSQLPSRVPVLGNAMQVAKVELWMGMSLFLGKFCWVSWSLGQGGSGCRKLSEYFWCVSNNFDLSNHQCLSVVIGSNTGSM
jgi:hypothetical protein